MALFASQAKRENLRDLLVCLTLGALFFVRRWYELELLLNRSIDYYRESPSESTFLYATLLASLITGLAFWGTWILVKRSGSMRAMRIAQAGFLLLLIYSLESVRRFWNGSEIPHKWMISIGIVLTETVLAAGVYLAWRGNSRIVRAARRVTVLLSVLFPLMLFEIAGGRLGTPPVEAFASRHSATPAPGLSQGRRVLWMVFDEFDQNIAFDRRPSSVKMPEFDRLRAESLHAVQAAETAEWTSIALPSLISGRPLTGTQLIDADELLVYSDSSPNGVNWRESPNIFQKARALGARTGLVGWYHPYCRVLGDNLDFCYARTSAHGTPVLVREFRAAEEGVWGMVAFLFKLRLTGILDSYRFDGVSEADRARERFVRRMEQRNFVEIRQRALAAAARPDLDFVLVHWPAPHPYGIWDRRKGEFSLSDSTDYLDNLDLVDRTLGELRRRMEAAGLWEKTSIVISSDHGLRPDVWKPKMGWSTELAALARSDARRVPVILKLAGESRSALYHRPLSSLVAHDLSLALVSGELRTAEDAVKWLDRWQPPKTATVTESGAK